MDETSRAFCSFSAASPLTKGKFVKFMKKKENPNIRKLVKCPHMHTKISDWPELQEIKRLNRITLVGDDVFTDMGVNIYKFHLITSASRAAGSVARTFQL